MAGRITTAPHQGLLGPEYTTSRPTRARRTSSRGRTGTSTSSSICCGSSSGRTSVFLGTVGVPTIALILLIALPFYDRRRERRLLRRPVAMVGARPRRSSRWAILTWKGATAKEALGSEVIADVPHWVKAREAADRAAVPGAKLFAVAGCTALPHLPRQRRLEPRRAGPDRDRHAGTSASTSRSRT